jgi:hypothetical protein
VAIFYAELSKTDRNGAGAPPQRNSPVGVLMFDQAKKQFQITSIDDEIANQWEKFFSKSLTFWHEFDWNSETPLNNLQSFGGYPSGLKSLPSGEEGELMYYEKLSKLSGAKKRSFKLAKGIFNSEDNSTSG